MLVSQVPSGVHNVNHIKLSPVQKINPERLQAGAVTRATCLQERWSVSVAEMLHRRTSGGPLDWTSLLVAKWLHCSWPAGKARALAAVHQRCCLLQRKDVITNHQYTLDQRYLNTKLCTKGTAAPLLHTMP